jgi:hypothetical protein
VVNSLGGLDVDVSCAVDLDVAAHVPELEEEPVYVLAS